MKTADKHWNVTCVRLHDYGRQQFTHTHKPHPISRVLIIQQSKIEKSTTVVVSKSVKDIILECSVYCQTNDKGTVVFVYSTTMTNKRVLKHSKKKIHEDMKIKKKSF